MTAITYIDPLGLPDFQQGSPPGPEISEIERLYAALDEVTWAAHPRTARLLASGLRKRSQKIVEEAAEVALETVRKSPKAAIRESADLIYHLVVLWHGCGIKPEQVWAEMRQRAETIGIAEKLPKKAGRRQPAI